MCACGCDKRPGFRQCCGSLKPPELQRPCETLEAMLEKDIEKNKLSQMGLKEFLAINELLLYCQVKGLYRPKK